MLELKIIHFTEIMRKKHDRNYFFFNTRMNLIGSRTSSEHA